MINVQQITSTLAQLPDAALQQYAEMHKSDPYTLALAVSESTRRKSMRQAAQAQQPAPAMSVADEEIGAMAPQPPAGLGAGADAVLPPAQGFAEGGPTSPRLQELEDALLRYKNANADVSGLEQAIAFEKSKLAPPEPEYGMGNEGRRETPFWGKTAAQAPVAAPAAAPAPAPLPAAPSPAAPVRAGLAAAASTRTAPAGGPPQLNLDTDAMLRAGVERNAAVTDAARKAAEQDLADWEAQLAARGKLGAGREERLRQQEAGLGAKQEQAKRDALLQAGFAILSADPSKGAWSAIGTGALQGLQGYKGDMADLAKQREALLDKLDELDTLRRQEAIADGKDRAALRARIRQVEVEGAKLNAELGNKLDLDVKPQAALAVFKEQAANWRSQQENATRLTAARIGASAGSRNSQDEIIRNIQASRPGMTYEQAYQVFAGSKQAGGVMDGYNDWAKANPMLAMGDPAKAVAAYLATAGAIKAAANAVQVTDRPNGAPLAR